MSFCSRCGKQVETVALFCPNCGASLTLHSVTQASQSPKLLPIFEKYFSKPFIYCIILSTILIFSTLIVGGSRGEHITVEQAQQTQIEIEKMMEKFTALDVFYNNIQVTLISFIPVIGSIWMLFAQYNTGYVFGSLAKAYGVNFFLITVLTIISPTGLLEFSAYILALSESFIIVYSTLKKKFLKRFSKQTWKSLLIVIVLLFIGGIVEAVSIGIPII